MKFKMTSAIPISLLIALTIVSSACDQSGGPVPDDVLKDAVDKTVARGALETGTPNAAVVGYKITNTYQRKVDDETFCIYEFDVDWTSTGFAQSVDAETKFPHQSKYVLAFVERGNSWYSREWKD